MILKYVHAHTKRLSSSLHIGRSWNYMCPSEAACSLDCICVGSGHMRVACNGGCPNYRTDAAHVLRSTHLTKERRFAHGASRPLRCRRSCRCLADSHPARRGRSRSGGVRFTHRRAATSSIQGADLELFTWRRRHSPLPALFPPSHCHHRLLHQLPSRSLRALGTRRRVA